MEDGEKNVSGLFTKCSIEGRTRAAMGKGFVIVEIIVVVSVERVGTKGSSERRDLCRRSSASYQIGSFGGRQSMRPSVVESGVGHEWIFLEAVRRIGKERAETTRRFFWLPRAFVGAGIRIIRLHGVCSVWLMDVTGEIKKGVEK